MTGISRSLTGTLRYTSNQPHRAGAERGREAFRLDLHRDGSRTLMAHCEIDDAPAVVRDVSMRMDAGQTVRDCSVRLAVGGHFRGSGWFSFSDHEAQCEAATTIEGRVSQRVPLETPLRAFGNHAIANDGQIVRLYDLARGPGKQRFSMLLSSPDHRGATGPMIYPIELSIEYVGDETVDVPAGRFPARHFRFLDVGMPEEHPVYDLWTSADEDYMTLRASVTGYMQTVYELTSHAVTEHDPDRT